MPQSTHHLTIGEAVVVKRYASWDRGEPEREWLALTLLHEAAPGLAPEPLERRTVDGVPEVVMRRVPGEPLGEAPLTAAQTTALARAMRALHAAPLEHADLSVRRAGPGEILDDLRAWLAEPHEPVPARVEDVLSAARAWLHGEEATALCGPLVERVFTQADGNLGNVLWDGERCRIVDFEDSGVSDPAYEVADLLEHVSVWLGGVVDDAALVDELALTAPQRGRLAGFRRLLATFWLLMLLPGNPAHPRNPAGTLERQAARVLDRIPHP